MGGEPSRERSFFPAEKGGGRLPTGEKCGFLCQILQNTRRQTMSEADSRNAAEEKILELSEKAGATAEEWIGALEAARQAGMGEETWEWAAKAQDALAGNGDAAGGTELLGWRAGKTPPAKMSSLDWLRAADVVAGTNPHLQALIKEAGFGERLAARECVRRFKVLQGLTAGALCWHRTWGFGVVRDVDTLNKRIEVDFKGRPRHPMAMRAAAETMEILSESHLMAENYRNPEKVQERVKGDAAGVVKQALASFGPITVSTLQERLTGGGVVAVPDWKRFWDSARKSLKAEGRVEIPSKKSEPMQLLGGKSGYDDSWFTRLQMDRDLKSVLGKLGELMGKEGAVANLSAGQRSAVANRVAFVVKGAVKDPRYRMQGVRLAAKLGLTAEECPWEAVADGWKAPEALLELLHDLPIREIAPTLEFLWGRDAEGTKSALLALLDQLNVSPLQESMGVLLEKGAEEECRKIFADALAGKRARAEMLVWVVKNAKRCADWDLPRAAELAPMMVDEMEKSYMGERLKAQKMLRERFEDEGWIRKVFDGMTPTRRQDFFKRICRTNAWSGMDRQGVQAVIIRAYPALQSVLTGDTETAAAPKAGPATSWRSYREKQEQLDKLINVDIPANAKEIGIARSYGDLRENFEYKAAKDMERVLAARQVELERALSQVRPSDFADAPTDVVGAGTAVTIRRGEGAPETYYVLGEWDNEESMHILSSATRLAQALIGHKAGDEVQVPGEAGETACRVESVGALPPEIVEWMK